MKKIGIVASLFFAFLLIFGASNFLGTQGVQAAAMSIELMVADLAANYVSNTGHPDTGGTGEVTVTVEDGDPGLGTITVSKLPTSVETRVSRMV